jgi:crotonobetainyl-CoA:carnitine CoA-transferase CaiB-like acyl-CoA transferase
MSENITESFLDQARKLNEQRLAAAQDIAAAVQARVDAEQALSHAQAAERKAFKDAERKGWSKAELDRLRPAPSRRRTKRTTAASRTGTDTSAAQQTTEPTESTPTPEGVTI